MPVQVINQDERNVMEFEGGEFYYRRPPLKMKKKWTNENTNARGVVDYYGIIEKAIDYCLIGWKDGSVVDSENKNIQFSLDVAHMLPENFYLKFGNVLDLVEPEEAIEKATKETKNLKGTSN